MQTGRLRTSACMPRAHGFRPVTSCWVWLQVGGPATAQVQWIPEFLAWTKANNVPVDFVSSHLYPTDPEVPTDRYGFYNTIAAAAQVVAAAGLPLVMTEFNSGLGLPGGQDSPYAAAFVAHQHLLFQNVSNVDTLSFWTFRYAPC
ncbi:MAG: hypothetical protein EOO65_04955 [Methanosarcinales archaeon]|nr:MAG: hypothetical protein EOO65_04955 [Methanosarcinales archaeon]